MHFTTLHGIYCIQSRCMEFTAFNWDPLHHDAWNPLRSIKIHCTTLHGIHCNLSRSIGPCCMESTAFNRDAFYHSAWITLHLITLHVIHGILIGIHFTKLYGIDCIQSGCLIPRCMDYPTFNHNAWNPLHSNGMLWAMLHKIHCIQSCCMESTAFNHAA